MVYTNISIYISMKSSECLKKKLLNYQTNCFTQRIEPFSGKENAA